jgi:DNA-directed RNA polymerase specialized sigma24 family protein
MNKLSREKRALILKCFTEGLGVNATARMADVSKNTVLKLLADLGQRQIADSLAEPVGAIVEAVKRLV